MLADDDFEGFFLNGNHLTSNDEFCRWFRKFLHKMANPKNIRAGYTFKREEPEMVKCIGVVCRGRKKFLSIYKGEHLCQSCRNRIRSLPPVRIQGIERGAVTPP